MGRFDEFFGYYDYNDQHPELRIGEKFLTNVFVESASQKDCAVTIHRKKIDGARLGMTAYNGNTGEVLKGMVPVFYDPKRWMS